MNRLYQIYESDLQTLEEVIPDLCERFSHFGLDDDTTTLLKGILSNVRWNYQPHTDHKIINPNEE